MFTHWIFRLICVCLTAMFLAIVTMRFGLANSLSAFLVLLAALAVAAVLGALSAAGVLVLLLRKQLVSGLLLFNIIFGLLPISVVALVVGDGFSAPPIHDITTDTNNPPVFVFAVDDRQPGDNSLLLTENIKSIQKVNYPEIQPLYLAQDYSAVISKVESLVASFGWQVLGRSQNPYQIEVVEKTALLGFKDDVAIRIQAVESGVIVDVRSASRVGTGDLGANASRVMRILNGLKVNSVN